MHLTSSLDLGLEGETLFSALCDPTQTLPSIDVIFFAHFGLTVEQSMDCHVILQDKLFASEAWHQQNQVACSLALEDALNEIVSQYGICLSLDSWLDDKDVPKG